MKRLAFVEECMIELREAYSSEDGTVYPTFRGDTLNSAVQAVRCLKSADAPIEYLTILGDDPFSSEMLAMWQAEGVGTELVTRRESTLPGLYAIRAHTAGERSFHYWRSKSPTRKLLADADAAALAASLAYFDLLPISTYYM